MLTNDMKKGQTGVMRGTHWPFTIWDNAKGLIRVAEVEGFCKEAGSIYTFDILYLNMPDGSREQVEFTPAQERQAKKIAQRMLELGF